MKRQSALRFLNETADEAVIEIYGQIGYEGWTRDEDENTAQLMSAELNRIKSLNAKHITVKINSLGGDVNHALAIHDMLKEHPADVTTQVNGLCASAATIVAMAGKERKMSKNALFLIHQCSAYVGRANEEKLAQELESQKTVNERMLAIYGECCPGKEQELAELLKANNGVGRWLTAEEAKSFGFVTDIYNETRKTACFTQSVLDNKAYVFDGNSGKFKAQDIPAEYADLLAQDEPRSPWQSFLDLLAKHLPTDNQPKTHIEMKRLFPLLAVALAFADSTSYDPEKGLTLTDEQLKTIEDKLGELDTLKKDNKALTDEKTTLTASLAEATKERDRLKAIVDKVPSQTPAVAGADPTPAPKDDIKAYVNGSALYQSIKHDI